jgi:stage III sporulation protein SpoIIIAA
VPYKDKAVKKVKDSLYKKSYYLLNKEAIKARVARNKRLARVRWVKFKSTQPCIVCGKSHPAIIDFHHVVRDGTQKSINRMAADSLWCRVYEEVKKCVPICANCHRIGHFLETHDPSENVHEVPKLKEYFRIQERQSAQEQKRLGVSGMHQEGRPGSQEQGSAKSEGKLSKMGAKE